MKTRTESTLNVIWGLLVRIVLTAILVWVVWKVRSVFITVILSAMLAYVLLPAVDFLCRRRVFRLSRKGQRLIASILVFIAFFAVVVITIKLLVSPFAREAENFVGQLDQYQQQLDVKLEQASAWWNQNIPEDLRKFLGNQDFKGIGDELAGFAGRVVQSTTSWFRSIVELVLIPVLAFYFVLDSRSLRKEFLTLLPPRRVRDGIRISREVSEILQSYVIGQIILCIIAGVITGVVLNAIGMKYALVLAVFAGITRAIPVIGPVFSGIPICLLGALQSIQLGILLLIFITIMHFAESKFIMPILIGERMKLHPAVILIVLLIGAELFGLLGMFLAAPIAAIIRELVYFYIIRPRNGRLLRGEEETMGELSSTLIRSERM